MCRDSEGTRHCGGTGCAGALPISARALSSAQNASQQLEVALGQLGVVAQKVGVVASWRFLGSTCVTFACPVCALSMPPCMTPFYVLFVPFPWLQACQLHMHLLCPFRDVLCATCVCAPLGHCCTLCLLAPPLHAPLQAHILSPRTPCSPQMSPPAAALCPLLSQVPLRCRRCRSWHGGHAAGQRRRWGALRPPAAVQRRRRPSCGTSSAESRPSWQVGPALHGHMGMARLSEPTLSPQ